MHRLIHSVLLFLIAATVLLPAHGKAETGFLSADPESRLGTIPHDAAMESAVRESDLRLVAVQHEGWQETIPSFARLKIYQITGREQIHGQDPVYTVLSMMYEGDRWYTARVLPVEHPQLLDALGLDGKWVSPKQVTESPRLMDLFRQLDDASLRERELARLRKLVNAVEQAQRLGREDRVLRQYETDPMNPVSGAEILNLLDNPAELQQLHERLRAIEAEVKSEKPFIKASNSILVRARALGELRREFLVVPDSESVDERWVRPVALGGEAVIPVQQAGRTFDLALERAFSLGDPSQIAPATEAFLSIVERSRLYPSREFRVAQNWYIQNNPWNRAAWIYLLGATCFALALFFQKRSFYWAGFSAMVLGFVFNSAAVGLRLYLKGHIPVSNMFEAITFCAWAVMLIALFIEGYQRRALVGVASTILAFLLLTGASLMPLHDTRIHPLRAVLNSYWLNIHVSMMLVSYAAFAIAAFFAVVYLARSLSARETARMTVAGGGAGAGLLAVYYLLSNYGHALSTTSGFVNMLIVTLEIATFLIGAFLLIGGAIVLVAFGMRVVVGRFSRIDGETILPMVQNEEFLYRLVQLGWPILTLGITLGAVWADTAWGRFWGWDPKETWAFITWVAYTVYLHMRMVMGWRGRWSAAACLIGFLMVLITWLGVSYLPWFSGGLHSYASPT